MGRDVTAGETAGFIMQIITDTQGSPSQSFSQSALSQFIQAWNLLAEKRVEVTVGDVAEMIAIERRVRRELYP